MEYFTRDMIWDIVALSTPTERVALVEKLFGWESDHRNEQAKYFAGTGLSLLASLLFAYLKNETSLHPKLAFASLVGALITTAVGLVRFWEVKQLHRTYPRTVNVITNLSSEVQKLPSFFR